MIDLSDLVRSAQGGQAAANIAARFGLSPSQAQSAIDALLPAIRMGLRQASRNGSAGSVLAHLGDPAHQQSFDTPAGAPPDGTAAGGSILGSLFGGHQAAGGVARQASVESGVPAAVIQAMMPVLVSIVMGGLARGAQTGSFGGVLSGILGSLFGQGPGPDRGVPPPSGLASMPSEPDGGGLGGMIGSVLGGMLGGEPPPAVTAGEADRPSAAPASATPESTLDELSAMLRSGTPSSAEHESRLASIIGR